MGSIRSIRDAQNRLLSKKWGVFHHYLWNPSVHAGEAEFSDWSRTVDGFDTDALAKTLHELGAGYYFITVVHGTEYMIAPNDRYEALCGVGVGTLCPRRDLILDLYESLAKYDIDLYLYFNCYAPVLDSFDFRYGKNFEPERHHPQYEGKSRYVSAEYVEKWASVLEVFTTRYGDKVKGWWFDSAYEWVGYNAELLAPYHRAVKKGNPYALAAFNNGVRDGVFKWYPGEEMTCGEMNEFSFVPAARFVDGAQAHLLIPLGYLPEGPWGWAEKNSKVTGDALREYVRSVNESGGVVSVDVHVHPNGSLEPIQRDILASLREI